MYWRSNTSSCAFSQSFFNTADSVFTSKFKWRWPTGSLTGPPDLWHQHNKTILILEPTLCAFMATGKIDWPIINLTTDKLKHAIKIRVLANNCLHEVPNQIKKLVDNHLK